MAKKRKFIPKQFNKLTVIIFILGFATIASVLILRSLAAGSSADIESESGTVTSPAIVQNDSTASGGKNVQFKAASSFPPGWTTLAWSDEFNASAVDTTHWNYDSQTFNYGTNGQHLDNVNLSRNVSEANGYVSIKAVKEDYAASDGTTAHWTAGSIQTKIPYVYKINQRIEFKARFDLKFRPVLWTTSPASGDDAEIDMPEFFHSQMRNHIGIIWDYNPLQKAQLEKSLTDTNWHTYACEWSTTGIKFYMDDVLVYTAPDNFMVNDHLVRISHQVGGTYDQPVDTSPTGNMDVDYVRVYSK